VITQIVTVNIFVFSKSIEEHERHLLQVFTKLRKAQLYLSCKKVELYMESIECLGYLIDSKGIHADADKMAKVQEWRTPCTYNDILRFLELVEYLAPYMPDIMVYSTLLSGCVKNNQPFEWTLLLDKCFESIKHLVVRAPILKPIDPLHPDAGSCLDPERV
jgi:hypothetical protein